MTYKIDDDCVVDDRGYVVYELEDTFSLEQAAVLVDLLNGGHDHREWCDDLEYIFEATCKERGIDTTPPWMVGVNAP